MKRFLVHFDRGATEDLVGIRDFLIPVTNDAFAEAFVDKIISYCEGLETVPQRGTVRDEIAPGLRIVGWRKTVSIAFQVNESTDRVLVLGVFYRGQDIASQLRQRRSRDQD